MSSGEVEAAPIKTAVKGRSRLLVKASPRSKIAGLAFIATAGIALAFICWIALDSILAARSVHWPQASGHTVESIVVEGHGRGAGRYYVEVQYKYEVGAEAFHSSRIRFGEDPYFGSSIEAAAFIARFPQFGNVPVRYSSSFPQVSVLLPGQLPSGFQWRILPFAAGFVMSLCMGIVMLRAGAGREQFEEAA